MKERERREVQALHRGRHLGHHLYRNFCMICGIPMQVTAERRYSRSEACHTCACGLPHD